MACSGIATAVIAASVAASEEALIGLSGQLWPRCVPRSAAGRGEIVVESRGIGEKPWPSPIPAVEKL